MLLPKYSIRVLLAIMTLAAMFAAVVSQAIAGSAWAMAVSLAIGSLVLAALLYTGLFCVAWVGSQITSGDVPTRESAALHAPRQSTGGE